MAHRDMSVCIVHEGGRKEGERPKKRAQVTQKSSPMNDVQQPVPKCEDTEQGWVEAGVLAVHLKV